jgi:hypothetical protein
MPSVCSSVQGLGTAEAYQNAAAYARERRQGHAADAADGPQPILVHPDVRKMLLTIWAFVEAGRALAVWTALELDKATRHPDAEERGAAEALVALLTPVIKAASSDLGFEASSIRRLRLHPRDGHGPVRARRAHRANLRRHQRGAGDGSGRLQAGPGGRSSPERFFALVRRTIGAGGAIAGADAFTAPLSDGLMRLKRATARLAERAAADPAEVGAAATDYLRLFALIALGWMWTRMPATRSRSAARPRCCTGRRSRSPASS